MRLANTNIIGSAKYKNIGLVCFLCHNSFMMTCEDFAFNKAGTKIYDSSGVDTETWVCPDCAKHLIEIKNL